MPDIIGTSRAQTNFLRSFRTSPFGPGVADWPSAAILRRWLRKPGFVRAVRELKKTMIYQSDFQLLSVAASASHVLHTTVTAGSDDAAQKKHVEMLASLLKLAHARQRFGLTELLPERPPEDPFKAMELIHPDLTVGKALSLLKDMGCQRALAAYPKESEAPPPEE